MYGVYDTKNNDLCLGVFNINGLMDYFNKSKAVIYCTISRKNKIKGRYLIQKI